MKVYAWLIDLIHRRKNCPTGMISGWVQKVTEHRGTIQYCLDAAVGWPLQTGYFQVGEFRGGDKFPAFIFGDAPRTNGGVHEELRQSVVQPVLLGGRHAPEGDHQPFDGLDGEQRMENLVLLCVQAQLRRHRAGKLLSRQDRHHQRAVRAANVHLADVGFGHVDGQVFGRQFEFVWLTGPAVADSDAPRALHSLSGVVWAKPVERSKVNQSINRSLTHSITHSLNHSLTHWINRSITRSITESIDHSITHSITESIDQSIKRKNII